MKLARSLPPLQAKVSYLVVFQTDGDRSMAWGGAIWALQSRPDLRLITVDERGLSRSRNLALKEAKGDVCLICDEDIVLSNDFGGLIRWAAGVYKEEELFAFQLENEKGQLFKNYASKSFQLSRRDLGRVSSCEIAFRPAALKKHGIHFDEQFGLGADFPTGEEFLLLQAAYEKGLRMRFVPQTIAMHPGETSGQKMSEKTIKGKGALFSKSYGNSAFGLVYRRLFAWRKRKAAGLSYGAFRKLMKAGSKAYQSLHKK